VNVMATTTANIPQQPIFLINDPITRRQRRRRLLLLLLLLLLLKITTFGCLIYHSKLKLDIYR
jgi:hypothetical protein